MASDRLACVSAFCSRYCLLVCLIAALAAAFSVVETGSRLRVTTDTETLFSDHLPWKQQDDRLEKQFPQNEETLVAVVEGDIPEEAQVTARQLGEMLRARPSVFRTVRAPGQTPHLLKNGLLFLDQKPLGTLLENTIDAQPALAIAGLGSIPLLRLDGDPLHTKNPNSESMRTLHLLMADLVTSPYVAEIVTKNLPAARTLAPKLAALPLVNDVL